LEQDVGDDDSADRSGGLSNGRRSKETEGATAHAATKGVELSAAISQEDIDFHSLFQANETTGT
jgi:hypothetical protein